jgi:hypothetical protein
MGFSAFDSRHAYSGVLLQQGRVELDADWNEEEEGDIDNGQAFGPLRFAFDPSLVQPAVVQGIPGIVGGLAVGEGSGDGTLGGGQGVSLRVTPGLGITAFGVEIGYAAGPLEENLFRLVFGCADPPCPRASNAANPSSDGGTLFLGVILDPGFRLDQVTVEARDHGPVGPGWQLAAITFSLVPEPATLAILAIGLAGLGATRRPRRS